MSIKLDIGKMKHVSSDDKSTTLKHPKGHTVTIYHNVLSKDNQDALKALSKVKSPKDISECQDDSKSEFGKVIQKAKGGTIPANKQQSLPFGGTSPGQPQAAMMYDGGPALDRTQTGSQVPATNGASQGATKTYNAKDLAAGSQTPVPTASIDEMKKGWWNDPKKKPQSKAKGGEICMDEGGKVPAPNAQQDTPPKSTTPHDTPSNVNTPSSVSDAINRITNGWAEGGEILMAEGGEANYAYDAGLPCLNPHCKSHGKPHPNCRCYSSASHFANGGEVSKVRYCANGTPHNASCMYAKGGISEQGRDVRHGNKQSNPDQKALAQNFAREDAKGRIVEERHIKPNIKGLAEGGKVDPKFDAINKKQEELAKSQGSSAKPPELMKKSNLHPPHIPSHTGYGRVGYAEGTTEVKQPLPVPGGGNVPTPTEAADLHAKAGDSYSRAAQLKEGKAPKDEADTERDMDKYEASQPPTALERSNQEREQARKQAQEPQPVNDTEAPPTGAPHLDQTDTYGHMDQASQDNTADMDPPSQAPAPQQSQIAQNPQDPSTQIPQSSAATPPVSPMDPLAAQHIRENQALQQDLNNGHLTPKTYHDLFAYNKDGTERSTLGKIGMMFSLLVGGMGSGITKQPNVVFQMMDNIIKNDLEAQQKSKDNAQNLLKIHQARLLNNANVKNVLASTEYTDAQKQEVLAKVKMKATTQSYMDAGSIAMFDQLRKLKTMTPGTKAYNDTAQTAMLMAQAVEHNNAQAAVMGAAGVRNLGNLSGQRDQNDNSAGQGMSPREQKFQDDMRLLENTGQGDKAALFRSTHITDVPGMANKAATVPDTEKMVQNSDVLNEKLQDVLDFAKQNKGSVNPAVIRQAAQKAHELSAFYNRSVDGLGLTPGRLGWLDEQIKTNPTSIIQQILGNNRALQEIKDSNNRRTNTQLHDTGFDVKRDSPIHYSQQGKPEVKQQSAQLDTSNELERFDPVSKKTVIYDAKTKKPLRWK